MATDKKISELPVLSGISANDISVLVNNGVDYQFSISLLLQYITSNISAGASIAFGTVFPQNNIGRNGDVFLKTSTGQFAQKISGIWTVTYTIPSASASDGTLLYGAGSPGSNTGKNSDSYIDTLSGVFYLKTDNEWSQVFSMQTGPQGPKGDKGDQGIQGLNGKSILSGDSNPSNQTTGTNGDFYINTNTLLLFGPKTNDNWGNGINLIQKASGEKYQISTSTPTLSNWQAVDASLYGNYPRLILLIENDEGKEVEAQGVSAIYTIDKSDHDNPLVTEIRWELAQPTNCRILIN